MKTARYYVAQAFTAEGLQSIVNNMFAKGFRPIGGICVTQMYQFTNREGNTEAIMLHTQALFAE